MNGSAWHRLEIEPTKGDRHPGGQLRHNAPWPRVACVYAIYHRNSLIYVGSTENLRQRLRNHFKTRSWRDRRMVCTPWGKCLASELFVKFRPSKKLGDWLMREYRLINRLKPRCNQKQMRRDWKTWNVDGAVV